MNPIKGCVNILVSPLEYVSPVEESKTSVNLVTTTGINTYDPTKLKLILNFP